MLLTRRTHIAFQILRYLAFRGEGASASSVELARDLAISKVYIQKIANLLIRGKLIKGVRGVGGGLSLARPATEIPIGMVLTVVDEVGVREANADGENPCLCEALDCAQQKFLDVLNEHTLADLCFGQLKDRRARNVRDVAASGVLEGARARGRGGRVHAASTGSK